MFFSLDVHFINPHFSYRGSYIYSKVNIVAAARNGGKLFFFVHQEDFLL